MALEDLTGPAKFINALVAGNPLFNDDKREGDDHLRGIKNVLKNQFPNLNAAVTATPAQLSNALASTNNLSDVGSAATSRTNLGVTASGADTAYAFRANNLSDLANKTTSRQNLGTQDANNTVLAGFVSGIVASNPQFWGTGGGLALQCDTVTTALRWYRGAVGASARYDLFSPSAAVVGHDIGSGFTSYEWDVSAVVKMTLDASGPAIPTTAALATSNKLLTTNEFVLGNTVGGKAYGGTTRTYTAFTSPTRQPGVSYTGPDYPIHVSVAFRTTATTDELRLIVDGNIVARTTGVVQDVTMGAIVPPAKAYQVTLVSGSPTQLGWMELR